jgi:succinyl-CoA synthetase beta subunit
MACCRYQGTLASGNFFFSRAKQLFVVKSELKRVAAGRRAKDGHVKIVESDFQTRKLASQPEKCDL